jgi:hypothetical protein
MSKTYGPFGLRDFRTGDRIEIAPHLDRWMMGDRFGFVVSVGKKYVQVCLDVSGKRFKLSPDNIFAVIE